MLNLIWLCVNIFFAQWAVRIMLNGKKMNLVSWSRKEKRKANSWINKLMQSAADRNRERNIFLSTPQNPLENFWLYEKILFNYFSSLNCVLYLARLSPLATGKMQCYPKNTVFCILAWFICSRTMNIFMAFNCICSCFACDWAWKLKGNHLLCICAPEK